MATALLQVILGVVQVPIQERLLSGLSGWKAEVATWAISLGLAVVATWVTGGYAGGFSPPPWDWADPSAFISYFSIALTPTRLTAAIAFHAFRERKLI